MDMPNFKDLLQKLSVFKSNVSLLVSTVLAVVAVLILVLTPLLLGSKLKKQIDTGSIAQLRRIRDMEPVPMAQWEVEQKHQESYARDANEIARLGRQSTERELLSYKIFPDPNGKSQFVFEEFGKRFRTRVEGLIAGMNATECPTDNELRSALESSRARVRPGMRRSSSPVGSPLTRLPGRLSGSPYGSMRFSRVESTIVDELCQQKATSGSVYANPVDVSGYEFWKTYEYAGISEAAKDCWYWQLGYWVVEDVIDTIAACNSGSSSVVTSAVKRLSRVSFNLGLEGRGSRSARRRARAYGGLRRPTTRRGDEDKPMYVLSATDGLAEPCTGRFCNDDIDVIHFNVVVLVSAEALLPFMDELCGAKEHRFSGFFDQEQEQTFKHNQISILESSWSPVDPESMAHRYYRYGEDAVVELDLICEYVFNKAGYDEIKPESIKASLQAEAQTGVR
jgi:hypothetical protein